MMRDGIDDALDLGDMNALPQVQVLPPNHGYGGQEVTVTEAEDDREFARRNIRDVIGDAKEALSSITQVASSTGSPKEAEALSKLLTSFVAANESLVNLADKAKVPESGQKAEVINNTQNVVMVGSGDDILRVVKRMRGESEEEDSLER
jgi:hypothetical protein